MLSTMSSKFRLFSFLSRNKSKPTVSVTSSHGPLNVNCLVIINYCLEIMTRTYNDLSKWFWVRYFTPYTLAHQNEIKTDGFLFKTRSSQDEPNPITKLTLPVSSKVDCPIKTKMYFVLTHLRIPLGGLGPIRYIKCHVPNWIYPLGVPRTL